MVISKVALDDHMAPWLSWLKRLSSKQEIMKKIYICVLKKWARPGFEPGTSRTLSENHTPSPTSQCYMEGHSN